MVSIEMEPSRKVISSVMLLLKFRPPITISASRIPNQNPKTVGSM